MSRWKKVKSLFVESEDEAPGTRVPQVDEAELMMMELPAGEIGDLPPGASGDSLGKGGAIDFQPLYDEAGIPNTDEVEALERFLGGIEDSLPQASKLAAAKAFLSAIGKSPNDVLRDAASKIKVVRAVEQAKTEWVGAQVSEHQAAIDELLRKAEEHKVAMERLKKELEDVRGQCAVEEGRLQGARVFFGVMDKLEAAPPPPPAKAPKK
ncbi:MAG: hypothetical protein HY698_06700 [Deltaproteobacteria bacterium]|nr:hypothetical protein [Deltaproteobacteria bacterium]